MSDARLPTKQVPLVFVVVFFIYCCIPPPPPSPVFRVFMSDARLPNVWVPPLLSVHPRNRTAIA